MPRNKFTKETGSKAGRLKGKHRKTKLIEQLLESLAGKHAERFDNLLEDMPDDEFAKMYKDLIKFIAPIKTHNVNEDVEDKLTRIEIIDVKSK